MIPTSCKRLIEVDFPIGVVSEHSAREKSIRHGHPSTLHLWWARRPLAACRAVLMGLLLPDPCDEDCPPDFKPKAWELLAKRFGERSRPEDMELRELLLQFVGELANWDNSNNQTYLEIARGLVKAAHPEETPVVVDPFSGGGSIPLEALRLGCEAFASDLNPVACLILKTLLGNIPKYGNADFTLKDDGDSDVVVHGLANALRHVGAQVKKAAEKELAEFYPSDPDGSRPFSYVWARTVRCEAMGCGADIPLVRSFWLCNKARRKVALRYQVKRMQGCTPELSFEVFQPGSGADVPQRTVDRANATCPCCHTVLPASRVRAQLTQQRGGAEVEFDSKGKRCGGALLMAVVTLHSVRAGRQYRVATDEDYASVRAARNRCDGMGDSELPDEPIPTTELRRISVPIYGLKTYGSMFTSRQRLCLAVLAKHIRRLSSKDAHHATLAELLSLALDKTADLGNSLAPWKPDAECPVHLYARQAVGMAWDWAESVPIGEASGSFESAFMRTANAIEANYFASPHIATVQPADACASPLPSQTTGVWFTDPPYYDSVPYSHLSDFFYVWLKRSLPSSLGNWFQAALTNKDAECVVDRPHSQSESQKTPVYYEGKMADAMREGRRVIRADGIGCVVFAHKTTEGWEALLSGMLRAGFVITASWPITTEMATRMVARDTAALAGSVHLVCRPRPKDAAIGDWGQVKAAMEKRIREWLPTLATHGVRGADAVFSCLGPALESYSKYEKVLTAADHEIPLGGDPEETEPHKRGFLTYVFEAVSKEALRQVLGDAETEGFEEDSRLTALFLWTLQTTRVSGEGQIQQAGSGEAEKPGKATSGFSMPFDTFIRITRPMGIHYQALENRVIEIEKGIVRLIPVSQRSEQLLGEVAKRPEMEISLKDIGQLELGLGVARTPSSALPKGRKKGARKTVAAVDETDIPFTTLDRIHRAMLLFGLGRSTLLRQVLEDELRQGKRFERLALALNALYPDGSHERRLLEGVQAAMRGVTT